VNDSNRVRRRSLRGSHEDITSVTNALVAEYNSLRSEIGRFQDHQKMVMQFAFTILAGLIATVGAGVGSSNVGALDRFTPLLSFVLGAVALSYFLLACLFADSIHRMNLAAQYIDSWLRPCFQEVTEVLVWDWEQFLAEHRSTVWTGSLNRFLHGVLDQVRWLVFVGPMALCIVAFALIPTLLGTDIGRWSFGACCASLVLTIVVARFSAERLEADQLLTTSTARQDRP
jgi:peptidoglycan/LPS O-acetylase OafA/YrhL